MCTRPDEGQKGRYRAMATPPAGHRITAHRSIVFKNILLFVLILIVAVVPLAISHYEDSRDAEIKALTAKLEVAAERGIARLDPVAVVSMTEPEHAQTSVYRSLLKVLQELEQNFEVDDAMLMRREDDGRYTYIALGSNDYDIGEYVEIHAWFPPTYKATEETWQQGTIMSSRLFGGKVIDEHLSGTLRSVCRLLTFTPLSATQLWHRVCSPAGTNYNFDFDLPQFVQVNAPVMLGTEVIAILMLNKFANPVAAAVRAKTLQVIGLTLGIIVAGLVLFGYASARMLRPLKNLTTIAGEVAQGNLDVDIPSARNQDEVGRLTVTFGTMLEGLRQRDFIRDTFGRYLSKEVVEEVLGSPDGLKLGGEIREITILVSDLRGFTSIAARLDPHDVIDILNRYLGRMVDILTRYRGTIDEFQGDGILAFFGAPLEAEDDQERAVACAIEMQTALVQINVEQRRRGLPELNMGIGINTGDVIVGNIGSETRTKYGAVGSTINEAYRIESYTVGGQILISPSVYHRVQDVVRIQSVEEVNFKGLSDAVRLYDVVEIQGKYACALPKRAPETFITLATPLPMTYFPVEGKTVSEQVLAGTITRLAASSAEAVLAQPVPLHSNLKLHLETAEFGGLSEAYAKVVAFTGDDASASSAQVCLGFTSLPEDVQAFLEQQRTSAYQEASAS
jgi:class 3 adenylate cyclase